MAVTRLAPDAAGDEDRFSEVIDVRSPSEFAESHIPGALNLPVLDDAERARVGTIHKQVSAFEARRLGAALIARRIAAHLEGHFADKPPSYRPLVYCWRGGQRSGSLATILGEVGWAVGVIDGGYKAWRREVRVWFEGLAAEARLPFTVVSGLTGSGKTRILRDLARRGEPVLDLEALANHRGSLLGREVEDPHQPSQKQFENRIHAFLRTLPPGTRVFVESESNRIGNLHVPGPLWTGLRRSPCIELEVPRPERARFLVAEYGHFTDDPGRLFELLEPLRAAVGGARLGAWEEMARAGEWLGVVDGLLEHRYDPAYRRSHARLYPWSAAWLSVDDLGSDEAVARAADQVLAADRAIDRESPPVLDLPS